MKGFKPVENLAGNRFGHWVVIERAYDATKSKGAKWLCECDCGTKRVVFGKYLRNGKSTSCGCTHKRDWIGARFGKLTVQKVNTD